MTRIKDAKDVYVNKKQLAFLITPQKIRTWIGGRGSGKTRVIAYLIRIMFTGLTINLGFKRIVYKPFARRRIFFMAPTIDQLKTKIWPEVQDALLEHGIKEHVDMNEPGHFVVGKVPPKHFAQPFKTPKKYDNIVTFINGLSIDLLGFHLNNNKRGGSYDAGILDEALEIDGVQFNKSIRPLTRGNQHSFKHPLKESLFILSSQPWKSKAKWLVTKMKRLAIEFVKDYFYIESSALDNKDVLGELYFENLRRELSPIEYSVEVENNPVTRVPNCYYPYLDDDRHSYTPKVDYKEVGTGKYEISQEHDVNPTIELDCSFDFNAAFTSCTMWQEFLPGKNDGQTGLARNQWELRCLRSFFVKETLVDDLVDKVARYYRDRKNKVINIYGGADGNHKKKALTERTYYERIRDKFIEHGWACNNRIDMRWADTAHKTKHENLNSVLKENDGRLPVVRINDQAASDVLISMGQSPIKGDFKKDKSSESDENLDQQFATHLGDTVDNYVMTKVKNPIQYSTGGGDLPTPW